MTNVLEITLLFWRTLVFLWFGFTENFSNTEKRGPNRNIHICATRNQQFFPLDVAVLRGVVSFKAKETAAKFPVFSTRIAGVSSRILFRSASPVDYKRTAIFHVFWDSGVLFTQSTLKFSVPLSQRVPPSHCPTWGYPHPVSGGYPCPIVSSEGIPLVLFQGEVPWAGQGVP